MADLFSQIENFDDAEMGRGARVPADAPLAERMRPRVLEEVVGQTHLIGPGKPLTELKGRLPSLILWGPPGTGKTTLARLLSGERKWRQISAVLAGVKELRDLIECEGGEGESFVLFVDEIHRWNKAQQDALLPYVESGTITLIGATTENPSFSLIAPLLSRTKLFVLRPLAAAELKSLLERALYDRERGLGVKGIAIDSEAWDALIAIADGDARRGLNTLELLAALSNHITVELVQNVFERKTLRHDKTGDQHYDVISALIKSMRGSDPDAALYYAARLVEAGDDLRFLFRRLLIFASEDIGNADPRALQVAAAGAEAFERIGDAEGWIPLAQTVTYLATAPKSNTAYAGYKAAKEALLRTGDLAVPLHLRNAATKLMKNLGYGSGYEYAHGQSGAIVSHDHLPDGLIGERFYLPTDRGYEKIIKERLEWLQSQKDQRKKS